MENQFSISLSDEQKKVVQLSDGQHLVLAPPGTGKTELLAHRVLYALEKGFKPEDMICLTFTNRAAKSMKERIEKVVGENEIFIGNIHKFCLYFLQKNNLLPASTILIDEQDSQEIFEEILSDEGLTLKSLQITGDDLRRLNSYIKQINKNFPYDLIPQVKILSPNTVHKLKNICLKYEQIKSDFLYIDFDDLLILTYEKIITREIKNFKKYKWIQVDEIQDLSSLQFKIIELISEDFSHKVFFGDYEQAIFSFMGAKLENIHKLEKHCKIHNLQKNFRSPSYLLNVFVDYAKRYLSPKWKKEPYSALEKATPDKHLIILKLTNTSKSEYSILIERYVKNFIKEKNSQTAILFRTNNSVDKMSNALINYGIPHFKVSSHDLFRSRVVKDIMAFLNCILNENSRMNWTRLFKLFARIQTLKEARHFVNSMFRSGLNPVDFLDSEISFKSDMAELIKLKNDSELIVFDTETTGLKTDQDDIIQIAAIKLKNEKIIDKFNIYLKTQKNLEHSQKIHNISKDFLEANGIDRREGLIKFLEFVKENPIAAHNLNFDFEMLINNCKRHGINIPENYLKRRLDVLNLTRRIFPELKSYSLENLINEFKLKGQNTHNACDDVIATVELINYLSRHINDKIETQTEFIKNNQEILTHFRKNLAEFWNECKSMMKTDIKVTEFIKRFLSYLNTKFNYKLEPLDQINLEKLFKHMDRYCVESSFEKNLMKYVPEYELLREADLILGDEKVIVSTIHRAKGLEFENVIIPDCIIGNFPFHNSWSEDKISEDARLLYVAMTRTKKRLIISGDKDDISPFLKAIEHRFEIEHITEQS